MKYIVITSYRHADTNHAVGCENAIHALGVFSAELNDRKKMAEAGDPMPRTISCYKFYETHYLVEVKLDAVAKDAMDEINSICEGLNVASTNNQKTLEKVRAEIKDAMELLEERHYDADENSFGDRSLDEAHAKLVKALTL